MMSEKNGYCDISYYKADFKCILQQMSSLKLNCTSELYALTDLKTSKACFMSKL